MTINEAGKIQTLESKNINKKKKQDTITMEAWSHHACVSSLKRKNSQENTVVKITKKKKQTVELGGNNTIPTILHKKKKKKRVNSESSLGFGPMSLFTLGGAAVT